MPRSAGRSVLRVRWIQTAILIGRGMRTLSRWLRIGAGGVIGGRLVLALAPGALPRLAEGRRVVLVSGTNGKTTTAHLIAAALRTAGRVAHNETGANMPDGLVAALAADRSAPFAVLEVDELYLGEITDALQPDVLVLLNLTRDQLDRGFEVQAVADSVSAAVARSPRSVVVANGDDPLVVRAVGDPAHVVWVAGGAEWQADAIGAMPPPPMAWTVHERGIRGPEGCTPVHLALPGRFNLGNAAMSMATAAALGVPPATAAAAISAVTSIAGRYSVVERGPHLLRLLLAKNPAGWSELLPLIAHAPALLLVINAHEADGRDTSWLWDVPFEQIDVPCVVASGERAADVGLRLSYAGIQHVTEPDPLVALERMPGGEVQVVANYTAFLGLRRRVDAGTAS